MTPQEKAIELVDKYRNTIMSFLSENMKDMNAKKCALIAVDEIIKAHIHNEGIRHLKWWGEVKQEIEKSLNKDNLTTI
jgi:hypothetical protein